MEISKEYLDGKLAFLKNQQEQAVGQVNYINGAIKVIESVLEDLTKLPVESKEKE